MSAKTFPVLCALAALLGGACSTVFVKRAPEVAQPGRWAPCTEVPVWPLADAAYAAALVATEFVIIAEDQKSGPFAGLGIAFGTPLVATGVAGFGYSAVKGYQRTRRCVEVHQQYEQQAAGLAPPSEAPPSALSPAPPAPVP